MYACWSTVRAPLWAQYYKTFFVRNLRILVISYSVCPLQVLQA